MRLGGALSDWHYFNSQLDDLSSWVEDVQDEVDCDIPTITGGKQLDKLSQQQEVGVFRLHCSVGDFVSSTAFFFLIFCTFCQ